MLSKGYFSNKVYFLCLVVDFKYCTPIMLKKTMMRMVIIIINSNLEIEFVLAVSFNASVS